MLCLTAIVVVTIFAQVLMAEKQPAVIHPCTICEQDAAPGTRWVHERCTAEQMSRYLQEHPEEAMKASEPDG
jgi:hypothetical protein